MKPKTNKTKNLKGNGFKNNVSSNNIKNELNQIKRELQHKKDKNKSGLQGKVLTCKGSDFVRSVEVFPPQMLDGDPVTGTKLVAKYDISPSSFPNTRLELISNTYQLYRFVKLSITYTSMLPTAVNGIFIAYIDTDPNEQESSGTTNDILRIARSHQGSIQGKIRDNWSIQMPERHDDQFFFIGDQGDVRFRKMGTLYVYQVGQATKFDGTPLEQELAAGILNINWTCTFNNPQLAQLDRIYDGVSEKDILRIFHQMSWYRRLDAGTITSAAQIPNTPFRQANFICNKDLFSDGVGDYRIVLMPLKLSITNSVKSLNTLALPYEVGQYVVGGAQGTDFFTLIQNAKLTAKELISFVREAYKTVKGGIKVALEIYDVIQVISSAFVLNQTIGVQTVVDVEDPDDVDIDHSDESMPFGSLVVHFDGSTSPLLQTLVEYQDIAHAADAATSFGYTVLAIAFKIKNPSRDNSQIQQSGEPSVQPSLPYLLPKF